MKTTTKSFSLFILFSLLIFSSGIAQTENLWTEEAPVNLLLFQKNTKTALPKSKKIYKLDLKQLKQRLQNTTISKSRFSKISKIILPFPDKEGNFQNYRITETSTLSPELQQKHPNIKSYIGVSNDSLKTIIRFSLSSLGLNSMKLTSEGNSEFIDPYTKDALTYSVYSKTDIEFSKPDYVCKVIDDVAIHLKNKNNSLAKATANDGKLRTFRLALSCTGEYAEFHIADQGLELATDDEKKTGILAAMNISMTRINGVFEKEMALTMQLIANNEDLIFLDPETDGYTSDDDFKMIDEIQAKCNVIIGSENYDIGHLFNNGFSGLAELSSPCTNKKAQGVSGRAPANGDSFDIDFVAHEMGHQFGATHTFNNSCQSNISINTSVEPGSGSTIMGYAGICSPDVQSHSDDYFHGISLEQMYNNIAFGNSTCADQSNIGNTPPTAYAGIDYTIPASTPFILTGSGTSGTGSLNYCWEQTNKEIANMPPVNTNAGGPVFRSLQGTSSTERHFPAIETTLAGNTGTTWEQLPSVSRDLKFRLTTRDNGSPTGQFDFDDMKVTVENTSKAFEVTSQKTTETIFAGESKTITWEIADTNIAPINTTLVNILLSTDGGLTFPTTLASNIANNGNYSIIVPDLTTTKARIKVEAVDNIFYNTNATNLIIKSSKFVMTLDENPLKTCAPEDVIYQFVYNTFLGFNETTTFSVSNLPTGTLVLFSPETAIEDGTIVTLTIANISSELNGAHQPILTGTSLTEENSINLSLVIDTEINTQPYLLHPTNNTHSLQTNIDFAWETETQTDSFIFEIAADLEFSNIVESSTTQFKKYTAINLNENETYYWRVREINSCNTGNNSLIYKFATGPVEEFRFNNTNIIEIPDNYPNGVSSTITIDNNIYISDISVTLHIAHTYVGDLKITFSNPSSKEIILIENSDKEGQNFTNTLFNDAASQTIAQGNAPFTGTFKPKEPLATYNNMLSPGNWTLSIVDTTAEDEGSLLNWTLTIIGINQNSLSNVIIPDEITPKITKAFSPNGDTINDNWTIENINTTGSDNSNFPFANIKIFNIRGQLVYVANQYRNNWNGTGTNGTKLPIGTYIYEVNFSDSKFKTQKGWLYLKY
jgi:gliding motility-associated-like protein